MKAVAFEILNPPVVLPSGEEYTFRLTGEHEERVGFSSPLCNGSVLTTQPQGRVSLSPGGVLTIGEGFLSDGPSWPALQTANFLRAAFTHDALYLLLRQGLLPRSYRKKADAVMFRICREDGMSLFRACIVYLGVRLGGARAARP